MKQSSIRKRENINSDWRQKIGFVPRMKIKIDPRLLNRFQKAMEKYLQSTEGNNLRVKVKRRYFGTAETEDVYYSQIFAKRAAKAYASARKKVNPDGKHEMQESI